MQVKKIDSSMIRKTDSKIRTGGQKVITAERKIRKDLTTSTMRDEEEEEKTEKSKAQNRRNEMPRKENPVVELAKDIWGSSAPVNPSIPVSPSLSINPRETYRKNDIEKVRKETAEKQQKAYIRRLDVQKALKSGGRYRKNQKRRVPSERQTNFVLQTKENSQKITYKPADTICQKSKKTITKETSKSFGREAVKTGEAVTTGVVTAGVSVGVNAAEKTAKLRVNKLKRVKARLLASIESERQQKKEAVIQQEKRKNMYLEEKQTQQDGKNLAGAAMLLLPAMLPMILIVVVLAAAFGSVVPEQNQNNSGSIVRIIDVAKKEETMANENIGGYKYKLWYGLDDNWCGMFVSWCANQCGYIDSGIMPKTASVDAMKKWYSKKNLYQTAASGYQPKPGDIIILGNGRSHTGIVIEYHADKQELVTIEGNTGKSTTEPYHKGSCVRKKTYSLTNKYIDGYGTPAYPAKEEPEETEKTEEGG